MARCTSPRAAMRVGRTRARAARDLDAWPDHPAPGDGGPEAGLDHNGRAPVPTRRARGAHQRDPAHPQPPVGRKPAFQLFEVALVLGKLLDCTPKQAPRLWRERFEESLDSFTNDNPRLHLDMALSKSEAS